MLTRDGIVKILDFGLASFRVEQQTQTLTSETSLSDETILTLDTTKLGTEGYVSPEQAKDARSADIRSDIFSLGCTLFYLLTGRPPFVGMPTNPDSVPDITEFRKDLPPELPRVLAKMMAWQPADRYQQPIEVSRALKSIDFEMTAEPSEVDAVVEEPISPIHRATNRWWYIALAILIIGGLVALILFLIQLGTG